MPEGDSQPTVLSIADAPDGSIWFGTVSGIRRFKDGSWTHHAPGRIVDAFEGNDGSMWFAHQAKGLSRFDGATWQTYDLPKSPEEALLVLSIWQTADGAIWAGGGSSRTMGGTTSRLFRLRDERWEIYNAEDISWLDQISFVHRGTVTRKGDAWLAYQNIVARVDVGSTRWTVHSHVPDALPSRYTADVLKTIGEDIWLGASIGATRFDGHQWLTYTAEDGLIDGQISCIWKDQTGNIWVGGQHRGESAVARHDGLRWYIYDASDGLLGENVYTGLTGQNGDIWIGTKYGSTNTSGHGVMQYREGVWKAFTTEDGLTSNMVYSLAETPDGSIWVGTVDGLNRFDGTEWHSYGPPQVKPGKIFTLSTSVDGSLWIGYGSGTYGATRYDGQTWSHITDKLVNQGVYRIHQTQEGSIWFGTRGGLSRYDGTNWTSYTRDEIPIRIGAAIRGIGDTPDGSIWIRGYHDAARLQLNTDPPETLLEPASKQVSSAGSVVLRWSGLSPWNQTAQRALRYRWRLDDGPWSPAARNTSHILTSLAPGDHSFEVQAMDRDGGVDTTPSVHAFVVETPWWRNPFVIVIVLFLVGSTSYQASRVVASNRKLKESNQALSSANNELFQVNVDLQREQVLERLRGQAQGMQSSEDIGPVLEAVYRELTGLGLPLIWSGVAIHLSDMEYENWVVGEDGRAREPLVQVLTGEHHLLREARLRGDSYWHVHLESEEVKERFRRSIEHDRPDHPMRVPEERWPHKMDEYLVFFDGGGNAGGFHLHSEEPIAEEYLMLIKRFGEVFGYAHSRGEELKQKEAQNRRLAVDASVQRLRAEVQSMDEASDFERILSLLTESLKTVELTFDGCEIDVLDEPVENPTMELFEANGFRYTTFRLDPDGNVAPRSYNVAAPFPTVIEQTIERFIAGEPWQAVVEGKESILEVPAGGYGRLRLTASDRGEFTDDEVATLREFADAVALGYARYLDIREIQEQTERKSAFLASMSHELRTPMNAIKGFTNLVLRRGKDQAWERNEENLQKVSQASDHLLGMIDDLLDLSKIEAGRMDVNAERFDVGELVTSACDTVSPLIQEGVELRQDVADNIGEANTDKARLQQMVINLLSNAIKFTENGMVTVTAQREQEEGRREKENLAIASSGSPVPGSRIPVLVIAVSDTGKGIPAEELPTIFDEYRQAEGSESSVQKGTGLGLSITKKFAELLGGSIGVESEVGKGSTFTVRVPAEYR